MEKLERLVIVSIIIIAVQSVNAQSVIKKVSSEAILERFLSYVTIESQSVDEPSATSFPMTDGQREMARHIYEEVKGFGGKGVKVTLSEDYYLYIDIPSNVKKHVPSILLMAHMDVSPEAPGAEIKPMVHSNYDGGDITLPGGITLSPQRPEGTHLKDLVGKTIVTSDGTTLLGADDKSGCTVLITMVEEIVKNPQFKHGRVMVCLSQNEDVGKAALRYDPSVFGDKPDVVIDVDGDTPGKFSVANFSAQGQTYYFKGNKVHPARGKENRYADALTAASYFVGLIPPEIHPSQREGEEGYVHCYYLAHPTDADGRTIDSDYVIKLRLRYFDKKEGEYQRQLLSENMRKTQEAFPFVEIEKTADELQYENIAYTLPPYVPELIITAARKAGVEMTTRSGRGGTTSAMMVARFPDLMHGGCDFYSGQQSEHSCYEWCCIEELASMVNVIENIIAMMSGL